MSPIKNKFSSKEDLISFLDVEISHSNYKLREFSSRILADPNLALSNCDDMFLAAAKIQVYTEALGVLMPSSSRMTLNKFKNYALKQVMRTSVIEPKESGSTSLKFLNRCVNRSWAELALSLF